MTCARCGSADARPCGLAGVELCERDELEVHAILRRFLHDPTDLGASPAEAGTSAFSRPGRT